MGETIVELSLVECLLFGAIISAVDPVAVIAVFEEIHVNIGMLTKKKSSIKIPHVYFCAHRNVQPIKALYICLFGESLLNDGIAVVLYRVFLSFLKMGPENIFFADICLAFAKFLVVGLGGIVLGIIYGFLGAFITKYTVNARIIEPTFVFTICFMAYLTAECFGLSAILAIVFCAFTMNSYVEHNISVKSHTTVKYGMKMISHICETLIFMCLGWAAISDFWKSWDTGFVLWKVHQLIHHFEPMH